MAKIVNDSNLQEFGIKLKSKLSAVATSGSYTDLLNKPTITSLTETTYSELKSKRDNSQLIPGSKYRITDYVATVDNSEARSANHPFDIIVTAISTNTLSEDCDAIIHNGDTYFSTSNLSAWKLKYCIDNDVNRFDWADSTNGKGVVYRLIDEYNNDVPYDFKGIQFKRYKVTPKTNYVDYLSSVSGQYIGTITDPSNHVMDGFDNDTSDYKWFYTFSYLNNGELSDYSISNTNGCFDNIIDGYTHGERNQSTNTFRNINNFVFAVGPDIEDICVTVCGENYEVHETTGAIAANKIGPISGYCTIFGSFNRVYTRAQFRSCILIGQFYENDFGSYFASNSIVTPKMCFSIIGESFCHNTIVADEIYGNSVGAHCDGNYIKCQRFNKNKLGDRFYSNVIKSTEVVTDNEFHSNMYNNTFNHAVSYVDFQGGQVRNCIFNNILLNCTFSGMCQYLTIDSGTSTDRLMNADVKYVSGTSSTQLVLSDTRLFWTSANNRHIVIERDSDGDIIATWKDNGQEVGIMLSSGSNTWITIADETTSNKVTSISASSTDVQYPSAKCVYDEIGGIEDMIGDIDTVLDNIINGS